MGAFPESRFNDAHIALHLPVRLWILGRNFNMFNPPRFTEHRKLGPKLAAPVSDDFIDARISM
jgi:hypothetical protein